MIFKTYRQLYLDVLHWSASLPRFDTVVGVPRSGMLPAIMLGKIWDVPVMSVDEYIERGAAHNPFVVDDSCGTGATMRLACSRLPRAISVGAVYATEEAKQCLDHYFQLTDLPRLFEWNAYQHRYVLRHSCMDIDGLLCPDPSTEERNDPAAYLQFMQNAPVWVKPSAPVGMLVTARLEIFRAQTTEWLKKNGIKYGTLVMEHRYPNVLARRAAGGNYAEGKAETYLQSRDMTLFYESEPKQAATIAKLTGKAVYCTSTSDWYPAKP